MVGKLTEGKDVISASRVANALGKGEYKSKQRQLQENIRENHGIYNVFDQNTAMELGDFFEEGIIRYAAKKLGLTEVETEFPEAFVHPFFPVECSLDGTAMADNLEIETDPSKGIYVVSNNED
jgi:hypothetical protein